MYVYTISITGCLRPDLQDDPMTWLTITVPGHVYNSKRSADIGIKDLQNCVEETNGAVSEFTTEDNVTLYFEKGDNPFSVESVEMQELDTQYNILERAIKNGTINLETHCNDTEFTWRGHTVTIGRLFGYNGHRQIGYSITFDGLDFNYDYELEKFEQVD